MQMKRNSCRGICWAAKAAILLGWAVGLHAQCTTNAGDKIVWSSHTLTGNTQDYIDASQKVLSTSTTDVCYAIQQSLIQLNTAPSSGCSSYNGRGVIDARGVVSSSGTFACASSNNPFPAASSSNQGAASVTVLLPAGTIPIPSPW